MQASTRMNKEKYDPSAQYEHNNRKLKPTENNKLAQLHLLEDSGEYNCEDH